MRTFKLDPRIEPEEATFVLGVVAGLSTSVGLVLRGPIQLERHRRVLERVSGCLLKREHVREWPGTRTSGPAALLHTYGCPREVASEIAEIYAATVDWTSVEVPGDFFFQRADGTLTLGSVTQHADIWLELKEVEIERLAQEERERLERAAPKPRALRPAEVRAFTSIAAAWESVEPAAGRALRDQVTRARVLDRIDCELEFFIPAGMPLIAAPDSFAPFEAVASVPGEAEAAIRLWIAQGRLIEQLLWQGDSWDFERDFYIRPLDPRT